MADNKSHARIQEKVLLEIEVQSLDKTIHNFSAWFCVLEPEPYELQAMLAQDLLTLMYISLMPLYNSGVKEWYLNHTYPVKSKKIPGAFTTGLAQIPNFILFYRLFIIGFFPVQI